MYQIQRKLDNGSWAVHAEYQLKADAQDVLLLLQDRLPEIEWRVFRVTPTVKT